MVSRIWVNFALDGAHKMAKQTAGHCKMHTIPSVCETVKQKKTLNLVEVEPNSMHISTAVVVQGKQMAIGIFFFCGVASKLLRLFLRCTPPVIMQSHHHVRCVGIGKLL